MAKVATKYGGQIAIKNLANKSNGEIKRVVTSTIKVAGRDRNAVKDLSWAVAQEAYQHLPAGLLGKTIPQIANSLTAGVVGYGGRSFFEN